MTNKKNNSHNKYLISHLERNHDREKFQCGIEPLNAYLKTQANQDLKKNVAVTYVITLTNSDQVLGYYTLSSIGIFPGHLPEKIIKKLPRYPTLPGILLGRLAVDQSHQRKKIGTYLLIDALKRSLDVSRQIGSVAIIVDAKDNASIVFYKKYGFIELSDNLQKLFLPMRTIQKLTL